MESGWGWKACRIISCGWYNLELAYDKNNGYIYDIWRLPVYNALASHYLIKNLFCMYCNNFFVVYIQTALRYKYKNV